MAALGRSWASLGWKANLSTRPGKRLHNYGKSPFFFGKIHYKLQFSIAMLNYQRVSFFISFRLCFQMSSLSCIYPVDISTIVEDNSCLVGGLEHFLFFHIYIYILGMSSSQRTFICFRGIDIPPTSCIFLYDLSVSTCLSPISLDHG